jgi:hypothetical protein
MKNIIGALLIALAIAGVGFYASSQWTALKQQELRNTARYQCAVSSNYETIDPSGAKVSYPVEELYKKCLQEAGL